MKYRYATLLAAKSLAAAGTETIDIKLTQPISRIDIRFEITKAAHTMSAHPAGDITKIELVDGSEVLHSLTGYENQALCIYDRRVPTMCHGQHLLNCSECSMYGIDFGRSLWDTLLAFDPVKFRNPQLKITYTLTTSDGGASAGELEVFAHVFDEKVITPIGFLMSKEHYSYTCGDENSFEYIQLPRDYPIRKLLTRAYGDGKEPWAVIKEVRLDEDNEKRIPLDVATEDYYRMMKGVWPAVEEQLLGWTSGVAVTFYVTPTDYFWSQAMIPISSQGDLWTAGIQPGGKATIQASASLTFLGTARGYLPLHCFEFPFGLQDDLEDWYDPTELASLRLRQRAGSYGSSGTSQVALQQLRRY